MAIAKTELHNRFWSKIDSNYSGVKHNVFKKDDSKEFQLVQKLTLAEADFNQFMRLKNQLVIAAEDFGREENMSPVPIPTMSKDKDKQLKLADRVADVVGRANGKFCVTLLRYNVAESDLSYTQVRLIAREKQARPFI